MSKAVESSAVWLTNGPAFVCGAKPDVGVVRQAVLDTSGLQDLVDALDEIINAAGSLTVQLEVGIRFEDDEVPEPAVAQVLDAALAKVSPDFEE